VKIIGLILKEIGYRKLNFSLGLLAVVVAVALVVAFVTVGEAYRKETRRIQLGLGQNLRIIPRETAMDRFWSRGYSEFTMPEEYVHRFASLDGYEYTHLTATLQKQVSWNDRVVILTGILPEVMPPGRHQPPMTFSVEPGEVYVGFEAARAAGIREGDRIDLFGLPVRVVKCLSPTGSSDDIRIFGHLHDIQKILGQAGRINEIRALECLCLFEGGLTDLDPLALAEQQLAEILPEAKVLLLEGIAQVRQRQRAAMESYLGLILPLLLLVCGAWFGVLAALNVRERRPEIGVLRALGYHTGRIAVLFLGRAAAIGLIGSLVGYLLGTALALTVAPQIFELSGRTVDPLYIWLLWSAILAPAFAVVFSFIPAMSAATVDPATTLRKA
jgi:ABC-type lipoprotein release transport system permease subunit